MKSNPLLEAQSSEVALPPIHFCRRELTEKMKTLFILLSSVEKIHFLCLIVLMQASWLLQKGAQRISLVLCDETRYKD